MQNSDKSGTNNEGTRAPIEQRFYSIVDFSLNYKPTGDISLYLGDSGVALFLAQMYLDTDKKEYQTKLHFLLDAISSNIEDSPENIDMSFCNGLAGYGWLISYLQKHGLIDLDENYFDVIDSILFEHLTYFVSASRFDQLHEGVSIGRYFLIRKNKYILSLLVNALYESCDRSHGEIKWKSFINGSNEPRYDFGLSHGMIGTAYFLSKCYALDIEPDICRELTYGIFQFYKNNEQDYNKYNSLYPGSVDASNYLPKKQSSKCRCAWCYGDLGVLYSMYMVAKNISNEDMLKYSADRLKIIRQKREPSASLINDMFMCHGASGVGYIYHKLYNHTNDYDFEVVAKYWYEVTAKMNIDHNGKTHNLLEGDIGVALAYISFLRSEYNDWDECIMLS